jgi:hypothetical protein
MRANLTGCPAKVSPKREPFAAGSLNRSPGGVSRPCAAGHALHNARHTSAGGHAKLQQAGIANPAWTVQTSVEMAEAGLPGVAVRILIAGESGKENYEQGIQ